jgi:lipopolysaccharide/colanic/teichoic acid biosynthesis glycosyltransferase
MAVRDYAGFSEEWQRRLFAVRPGITCLWQISGNSSVALISGRISICNTSKMWSLWLDLKILAWTVPAVLKWSGAA